jgi:Fic family protein
MPPPTPALPDVRKADAAYKPFPPFAEWSSGLKVDTTRLERYKAELNNLRATISPELLARSLEVVKRAAAIDTGALEGLYETDRGFTFTVATEAAYWQVALQEKGPEVQALFESQLGAYDFVLDLATERAPVVEAWIRTLHERLCAPQATYKVWTEIGPQDQPLPKGEYKHHPNHVLRADGKMHSYAPADMTPAEMHRFCDELRGPDFSSAHPALQTAYAHYAFVVIHPFSDGNGRVARAMASLYSYRAYSIPLLVLSDARKEYLSALESADGGDHQVFVDFVVDRILDGVRLAEDSLRTATLPAQEDVIASLRGLYVTRGGYSHQQVDGAGQQLLELFNHELGRQAAEASVDGVVSVQAIERPVGADAASAAYRPLGIAQSQKGISVHARTMPPVEASATHMFVVEVPKDAGVEDDLVIRGLVGGERFQARIAELLPVPAVTLQMRLRMFVERAITTVLEKVRADAARRMNR